LSKEFQPIERSKAEQQCGFTQLTFELITKIFNLAKGHLDFSDFSLPQFGSAV
jgi:hypothetical protein